MTETKTTANDEAKANALANVVEMENGTQDLDLPKYKNAISVLKDSEIEDIYLKIPPRLTPKIVKALEIAKTFYKQFLGKEQAQIILPEILKLNRKLSHYAHHEPWTEEMHIAAIFSHCRPFEKFNPTYLRSILKADVFGRGSIQIIAQILFGVPDTKQTWFNENDQVVKWRSDVRDYLAKLIAAPVPSVLIVLAVELNSVYFIQGELEKKNVNVWTTSHLAPEPKDQVWYYGEIIDCSKKVNDDTRNVLQMALEFQGIMAEVHKFLLAERTQQAAEQHV